MGTCQRRSVQILTTKAFCNFLHIVQLKQKILQVFEKLKNDNMLQSVQLSLIRRAHLCMQQRGQHF